MRSVILHTDDFQTGQECLVKAGEMDLDLTDRFPKPAGVRGSGEKRNEPFGQMAFTEVFVELVYPGTDALECRPVGLLTLPWSTEQGTSQGLVPVVNLPALLIGQDRIDHGELFGIAARQHTLCKPLQTSL
ncbi:hypothetical protein D3C84_605520 [compost metagenome]